MKVVEEAKLGVPNRRNKNVVNLPKEPKESLQVCSCENDFCQDLLHQKICPEDLEIDDLNRYFPLKPNVLNDLVGFVHYKCHKNGTKKDPQGLDLPKYSNLNYGIRPIFRNQIFEGKIEDNRT
jgi:hypothetical protein